MGMAQQQQKPVAVVCTSGSALLNYHPAIAEAFYSKIPLVVISADRPKHLIDIGDGQTIRQENVFVNHILFSANLVDEEKEVETNTVLLCKALHTAITKKGPVHINVPFDEPLYDTVKQLDKSIIDRVKYGAQKIAKTYGDTVISDESFVEMWKKAERKIILIGANDPASKLQDLLSRFADDDSVLVMTETISNVCHPDFINSIDQLITPLTEDAFKKLQPEILITLGGMIVSKRIKQFFRKYQPMHHWHVDELTKLDTYFCLSEFIQKKPEEFLLTLLNGEKHIESNYRRSWLKIKKDVKASHSKYIKEVPYSDLKVIGILLRSVPNDCQLQLSNSAVIRYTQLFDMNPTLRVFCNRGTSGIDGSTTTAIGAAVATKEQTVFITGDISFYYDSNALWNNYIPNNFRIIIVNNSGGGIFKIIPGPKKTNALEFFETPHNLTAEHIAKTYGFGYTAVTNSKELHGCLTSFYLKSEKPKILEIFTPSDVNDHILKQYFNSL